MTKIINYEKKVSASVMITTVARSLVAREEADNFARNNKGFVINTMPQLISELAQPNVRKILKLNRVEVNSAEYISSSNLYAVGHGLPPLSITKHLKLGWYSKLNYCFMPIDKSEWGSLINGPNMFNLKEIKGNKSFNADEFKSFGIYSELRDMNFYSMGVLSPEQFMSSDRILMAAGSEMKREKLANILFNEEKMSVVGDHHRFNILNFDSFSGRPLVFNKKLEGIGGNETFNAVGCFVLTMIDHYKTVPKVNGLENKLMIEIGQPFDCKGVHYEFQNGVYSAVGKK